VHDVNRKVLPHEVNAAAVTELPWLFKSAARAITHSMYHAKVSQDEWSIALTVDSICRSW